VAIVSPYDFSADNASRSPEDQVPKTIEPAGIADLRSEQLGIDANEVAAL
jgi:hypothetical protein